MNSTNCAGAKPMPRRAFLKGFLVFSGYLLLMPLLKTFSSMVSGSRWGKEKRQMVKARHYTRLAG